VLPVVAILLLAATAYANSFGAAFHFDDFPQIVENPLLRDRLAYMAPWTMAGRLPPGEFASAYLPRLVGNVTFGLNVWLNGFTVGGFHVVNFLIHVAAALLLRSLVVTLFRSPRLARSSIAPWAEHVALAAAALFVAHPIQTQAVTYIVQRYASLSTLLGLASLLAWASWRTKTSPPLLRTVLALTLAVCAAAAAMLTKESAVTFPLLALLAELLFFEGPLGRRVAGLAPLLATMALPLAIAASAGGVSAERIAAGGDEALQQMGLSHADFLLTECRVVATYLRLLVLPLGQNLFWDYPISHAFTEPGVLPSGLLHLTLLGLGGWLYLRSRRGEPALALVAFGILWFYGALFIESGAIVIVDVINEHRLYYPSAGFFVAVVAGGALLAREASARWPAAPRALAGLCAAAAFVLAGASFERNRAWADEVSLWSDVAEKSPNLPQGHYMHGRALRLAGRFGEAEAAQRRALAASPYYFNSYRELSLVYSDSSRPGRALHATAVERYLTYDLDGALALWDRALAISPVDADAHYGRALALGAKGRNEAASEELRVACAMGSAQACRSIATGARDRPVP
jgi:tetratricopeptide (TPR) repeat protein